MALPMLLGITTMMAQSFIDAWFLGRVGDRALAAYSFGFPILMIVTSVAIGLGAGTSSVVARAIGAEDHRRAKRLVTDSLILSFLITAIISVVGVLTINPLFRLLGAPDDMIPMIRTFMIILYSGVPFFVVGMVGTSGMRATGDTRLPSKIMISGAILNVILDPIFIFGVGPVPAMGLNGAATAAILARGSIFVGTLYLLQHRLDMVSFRKPELQELKRSWADILHVGLPAAGTNAIIPVGLAVITAMIARFGPEAVAGFGVASRIESLVLVLYYALSAVIGPFVGQNLSAGKEDRIQLSLRLCRMFLWIAPVSYGAYGIVMVVNAAFNGLGNPMPGVVISVTRIVVLYVPLAIIGMRLYGISGIFLAYAAANIVSGMIGYYWAKSNAHRLSQLSMSQSLG
jgi:putative MATE family efflux protein